MTPVIVVADSSVWIDHINQGDAELEALLRRNRIAMHPMIYAEVALGSIVRRKALLAELRELPQIAAVPHVEVVAMIEWLEMFNKGIGYVDAHLLAATHLAHGHLLFTRDKRLKAQAEQLDIAYQP